MTTYNMHNSPRILFNHMHFVERGRRDLMRSRIRIDVFGAFSIAETLRAFLAPISFPDISGV